MKTIILALALSAFAAEVHAEGWVLPMAAKPKDVGLSSMQLKRIETATQKHIDDGLVPGAVMLVARRGKVAWVSTLGKRDPAASPDPMKADSIVSLAVMQMVEEGRLQVSDPVSKFLPEMGKMKVAQEKTAADGTHSLLLSDPERPMTVQDLLRHTSGLIYGGRGSSLVNQAYVAAKIGDRSMSNQEFVTKLSTLPLRFSPGARWEYGVSTDVLGRLIEVVDGKTLGESLSERIFKPLGMVDTQFQVPAAKVARAAQPGPRPGGQPMTPRFKVDDGAKYESGGGGLTSTMADYLRFAAMLSNGGELDGKRLIGKQTLAFMTADHTGPTRPGRPPGLGFGLGFEVRTMTGEAALPGSVGEYGWAGNAGTLFWVDPRNELTAIYMVQVSDPDRIALRNQFRSMVQAAIID